MAERLTAVQEKFANNIYSSGAFKTGEFRLKLHETNPDAPLSPYYISLREDDVLPETYQPLVRSMIVCMNIGVESLVWPSQLRNAFDRVIGIPNAATPIAKAYSVMTNLPMLEMVKDESGPVRKITSTVLGEIQPGLKILGVDDLITGADTKFEFKDGLEANKLELVHLAVGLDREQGGMQKLIEAEVSVSAALTVTQLLDYYVYSNRISPASFDQIHEYIRSQS